MRNFIIILSIFLIGFTTNQQAQAQTVTQVYGYKLTQQHVNIYHHFMGLAKGVALTSQEKAYIKQNLINNFKINPTYVIAEANNLILAKNNPYQSTMIVNNYRMMLQQQYARSYQQNNATQQNNLQLQSQLEQQRHNAAMRGIYNMGGGYEEEGGYFDGW